MQKNITLIVLLILFGCSEPQYREVMVNKTVKVFSKGYHEQAENYTFKWKPPIGPNKEKIIFDLKNDMLLFTPKTAGNYEVNLSIEDISEEVVAKELFYFKAIPETTEVAIVKPKKGTQSPVPPTTTEKKPKKRAAQKTQPKTDKEQKSNKTSERKKQPSKFKISNVEYALQISAWPTLEEARKHQLELIDEGFDAYTQHFYLKKKDQVWYRVRVGNFSNRNKALKMKKQIESVTGITTWLDIVSTK